MLLVKVDLKLAKVLVQLELAQKVPVFQVLGQQVLPTQLAVRGQRPGLVTKVRLVLVLGVVTFSS